jgi:Uma2 family endonuclease
MQESLMVTVAEPPRAWTVADLFEEFGPIPAHRIRSDPAPGTATEEDVLDIHAREKRLCELVDGVLVEKTMGFYESRLALVMGYFLEAFVHKNNLGIVVGADGMMRLAPGLVRIPDVSFVSSDRLTNGRTPQESLPDLVPDLAVEVLSRGNTQKEMARKLRDYFSLGVRLVWFVDPPTRSVRVYTGLAAGEEKAISLEQSLDGGAVLPGFTLPVRELFARADLEKPKST